MSWYKYKTQIKILQDDIDFINKIMKINPWKNFTDLRYCDLKHYTGHFEDGYSVDVTICHGQNNWCLGPTLYNKNGHQVCMLECADTILGEYEFEDEGNIYILEIVKED